MNNLLFIFSLNLGFLVFIYWLRHKKIVSQFAARKILHIGSAFGAVLAISLLNQVEYILIAFVFFLIYLVLKKYRKLGAIEIKHLVNYGEPLYPVGLIAMGILLWDNATMHVIGILILGVPDALAAIGEKCFYSNSHKSQIIKSVIYFIASITILVTGIPAREGLVIALLLTITEAKSPFGIDNITVPIVYSLSILFSSLI
jgi:phytol kinase